MRAEVVKLVHIHVGSVWPNLGRCTATWHGCLSKGHGATAIMWCRAGRLSSAMHVHQCCASSPPVGDSYISPAECGGSPIQCCQHVSVALQTSKRALTSWGGWACVLTLVPEGVHVGNWIS